MEYTKGELIAEIKQSDLTEEKARCSIGIESGKILFHTTLENPVANAKELLRRWNACEKDGIVDELVVAWKIGLDSMQGLLKIADKLKASNKDKKEHNEHIRFVKSVIAKVKA